MYLLLTMHLDLNDLNIPLDERILNCRYSWTRRIIENAFGITEIKDQLLQIQKKSNLDYKVSCCTSLFPDKKTRKSK